MTFSMTPQKINKQQVAVDSVVFEYDFERVDEAKDAKDEDKIPGAVVKGYTLRNFLFCCENIFKKAMSRQVRFPYG